MGKYNRYTVPVKRPSIYKNPENNMSVVILGASVGHRMKSYGPKLLFRLPSGKTILENILEHIVLCFPHAEIIATVGFQADRVIKTMEKGIYIVENQLYETTNVIEEARLALNTATNTNVLFIHGDLIFNNQVFDNLHREESSVVIDTKEKINSEDVGLTVVDSQATIFAYDLPVKWCHIAYLTGKELTTFADFCNNRANNKKFMFEGLNHVLACGYKLRAIESEHMEIDRIETSKDITTP